MIVSFLHDGVVEVVEVEFTLQRYFVVCFKEVEGERCFGKTERCWVPALAKELAIALLSRIAHPAFAKRDPYFMPTVCVDDGELTARGAHRARGATVPEMEDITE